MPAQTPPEGGRELATDEDDLRPFHGFLSPGICFDAGYCIWLFRFSSTPTSIDAYDALWVVTPDDERVLYVDPVDAGRVVGLYHDFDRTIDADIAWRRVDMEGVEVGMEAADGTSLSLEARLGGSVRTRFLHAITRVTPQPVLRTSVGEAISNLSFGMVMDTNGLQVAGRTETDQPYRNEADTLRLVTHASATLNDEDLGELTAPDRVIEFGDAIVPDEAFVSFGDLYLPRPVE